MSVQTSPAFLIHLRAQIDFALRRFFTQEIRRSSHPLGKRLMKSIAEFTLRKGAKRSRGILVVLGYLCGKGNTVTKDILDIAAAYELLHAYLLVHDDIIDRDTVRRGKPTLHRLYAGYAPSKLSRSDRAAIGNDIAIIAGDIAADLVQRLILSTGFTPRQKLDALAYIEQVLHTTYIGQIIDILAVPQRVPPHSEQLRRYILKTATYTIEGPFTLGVRLGRGSIRSQVFSAFAKAVGVAFQLADDIENAFGTSLAARSSDIRQGKVTLLVSFALQSRTHRRQLLRLLSRPHKTNKDLQDLRTLLIVSGGYGRARDVVHRGYRRGETLLVKSGLPPHILRHFQAVIGRQRELVEGKKKAPST